MNHQPDERLEAYLWDPAAAPDEAVVEIERRLSPVRFDPLAHPLPASAGRDRAPAARPRHGWLWSFAWATAVLVIACAGYAAWRWTWPEGRAWQVMTSASAGELAVGSTLKTGASDSAIVRIARIGTMRIAGATTVGLRSTASNRHRLVLHDGSVRVRVWAPPFSVSFRTPAGDVSDLGCEFELTVDGEASRVQVSSGWVQLENIFGETLVPAGAMSVMTSSERPAVPVFIDSAPGFAEAVRAHERAPADPAPIDRIVTLGRPRDVFTLLHLVQRRSAATPRLVQRAAALFPPPAGVDPVRVAAGDRHALDRWMQALPLPSPKGTWLWNWRDGFPFFGDASR